MKFVTDDGKEFDTYSEAQEYERRQREVKPQIRMYSFAGKKFVTVSAEDYPHELAAKNTKLVAEMLLGKLGYSLNYDENGNFVCKKSLELVREDDELDWDSLLSLNLRAVSVETDNIFVYGDTYVLFYNKGILMKYIEEASRVQNHNAAVDLLFSMMFGGL